MDTLAKLILVALFLMVVHVSCKQTKQEDPSGFNYYAWCIVPFDSENRTPEERVDMLKRLGFKAYAYDWREEHLSQMGHEIDVARENGIGINGVWLWVNKGDSVGVLNSSNRRVMEALEKTGLETQVWMSFPEDYFEGMSPEERLDTAVKMVSFISYEAEKIGCTTGLYNHGGWFGDPINLVKIARSIPGRDIGIIFNFHHAHNLLDQYEALVDTIMPYLWAVNLNGMNPEGPKILTVGQGSKEEEMIAILREKGYKGPWGILDHRMEEDSEKVLKANLEGARKILDQ